LLFCTGLIKRGVVAIAIVGLSDTPPGADAPPNQTVRSERMEGCGRD
jgi:hypothetical protein